MLPFACISRAQDLIISISDTRENEAFRISRSKTRTVLGVQLSNELIGLTLAKFYYRDVITSSHNIFPPPPSLLVIGSSRVPHVITPSRRDNMLTSRAVVSTIRARIPERVLATRLTNRLIVARTINQKSFEGSSYRSSIPFSKFHWKLSLLSTEQLIPLWKKRRNLFASESRIRIFLFSTRGESAKYQVARSS